MQRPPHADVWRQSTEAPSALLATPPPWAAERSSEAWRPAEGRRNRRYATWWERAKATLWDGLFLVAVAVVVTMANLPYGLVYAAHVGNSVVFHGLTGQTFGKRRVGIFVVRDRDEQPPGLVRILVRDVAHVLDVLSLGLGYLLPLVEKKRRTIADLVCRTVVVS